MKLVVLELLCKITTGGATAVVGEAQTGGEFVMVFLEYGGKATCGVVVR